MDKEKLKLLKSFINKGDFQSFISNSHNLTLEEVRVIYDNYIKKYASKPEPVFIDWLLENHTAIFFRYLTRLYNKQHCNQILSDSKILMYENDYCAEIISLIKVGFFFAQNKPDYIALLDKVDFKNNDILLIIHELEILKEFSQVSENELHKCITSIKNYPFDEIIICFGLYLQELSDERESTILKFYEREYVSAIKLFYNSAQNKELTNLLEKYPLFLLALINDFELPSKMKINEDTLSKSYKKGVAKSKYISLKKLFDAYYWSKNINGFIEVYCYEQNVILKEMSDGSLKFLYNDKEVLSKYNTNGLKYQYLHAYYMLKGQAFYEIAESSGEIDKSDSSKGNYSDNKFYLMRYYADLWFLEENGYKDILKIDNVEVNTKEIVFFFEILQTNSLIRYNEAINQNIVDHYLLRLFSLLITNLKKGKGSIASFRVQSVAEWVETISSNPHTKPENAHATIDICCFNLKGDNKTRKPFLILDDNVLMFEPLLIKNVFMFTAFNMFFENKLNDSSFYEQRMNEALKHHDFSVLEHKSMELDNIEFDVLAFKDNVLFIGEIKSTYFRQEIFEIFSHLHSQINHAVFQLDVRKDYVINNWEKVSKALNIPGIDLADIHIKTLIISSTFETDNSYFNGHQGISFFELINVLENNKSALNNTVIHSNVTASNQQGQIFEQIDEYLQRVFSNEFDKPEFQLWFTEKSGASENILSQEAEKNLLFHKESKISGKRLLVIIEQNLFWDFLKNDENEINLEIFHFLPQSTNTTHIKIAEKAVMHFRKNEFKKALDLYLKADNLFPNCSKYKILIASCILKFQKPKIDEAIQFLLEAYEIDKNDEILNENCLLLLSETYFSKQDFDKALLYIEEGIKSIDFSKNVHLWIMFYFKKSIMLFIKKNYTEAFKYLYEILLFNEANDFDSSHLKPIFNDILKNTVEKDNLSYDELLYIGHIYLIENNPIKAIEYWEGAKSLTDDFSDIYHFLAYAYEKAGQSKKAIEYQVKTIEINQTTQAFEYLGSLFHKEKQFELALYYFNKAIEIDENNYNAYCYRGKNYLNQKKFDNAISDLWIAIKLNPRLKNAYVTLLLIYQTLHRYKSIEYTIVLAKYNDINIQKE